MRPAGIDCLVAGHRARNSGSIEPMNFCLARTVGSNIVHLMKPNQHTMKTNSLTRRKFLKSSFLTAAACTLTPRSWSQVRSANDNVRVAVIGINDRGGAHISEYKRMEGVRIVALCDVDLKVLD